MAHAIGEVPRGQRQKQHREEEDESEEAQCSRRARSFVDFPPDGDAPRLEDRCGEGNAEEERAEVGVFEGDVGVVAGHHGILP